MTNEQTIKIERRWSRLRFDVPAADRSASTSDVFRKIDHAETSLHDPVRQKWDKGCDDDGVRLYCTASPSFGENARWSLQVRARVKNKSGGVGKRFAVGTASMSREDLEWLRDSINAELRRRS